MSILAAATPDDVSAVQAYWLAGVVLVIAAGAIVTGLLRPRPLDLPDRIPTYRSAWPFFGVTAAGLFLWLGSQVAYGIYIFAKMGTPTQPVAFDESMLTAADFAFLATVPFFLAMAALLIGDIMLGRDVLSGLGVGWPKVLPGVGWGALAMVLVMPVMLLAGVLLQLAYKKIGFEHPTEHTLLTVLGESNQPFVQGLIIVGATIAAPLFEELLFRAHIQTLLRRLCLWMAGHAPTTGIGFDVAVPMPGGMPMPGPLPTQSGPPMQSGPPPSGPPPWAAYPPIPQPPAVPWAPPLTNTPGSLPLPPPGQPAVLPFPTGASAQPLHPAYATPVLPSPAGGTYPSWPSWVAIFVTSGVFAIIHEAWTAPLIFLLALCLGYAYERTNNLWIPITMHAIFNIANTVFFLVGTGQ